VCLYIVCVVHLRGHEFVARVAGICTQQPQNTRHSDGTSFHSRVDRNTTKLAGVASTHLLVAVNTESVNFAHLLHSMRVSVIDNAQASWGLAKPDGGSHKPVGGC